MEIEAGLSVGTDLIFVDNALGRKQRVWDSGSIDDEEVPVYIHE